MPLRWSRVDSSMLVPMMQVGIMRMAMGERLVTVRVGVWLARRIVRAVRVLMVLVVHVPMLMLHRRMPMLVLVPLAKVQVDSKTHERPGGE